MIWHCPEGNARRLGLNWRYKPSPASAGGGLELVVLFTTRRYVRFRYATSARRRLIFDFSGIRGPYWVLRLPDGR